MSDRLVVIFVLFTLINFSYSQASSTIFRPSNIEIKPNNVVIDSNSTTDFWCINHQPNNLPLQTSLSKTILSDQIKISTIFSNATTLHIQLISNNYVGIFNLLCYEEGRQTYGIYADVFVKAAPGVLQLVERCRVYERQYIKCIIRAPRIATAIQNGYVPKFKFTETNRRPDQWAYVSDVIFVKNESTNELLVFQWKPTVEGEFPNGVRMEMKQLLHHFEPSVYNFDMTPTFIINPKFLLTTFSPSRIQINLTSISSPVYCEKSYMPSTISNVNRTWTMIEPGKNSIFIDNLLPNSIYNVCIKCRKVFSDPDGPTECQEIKTWPTRTLPILIAIFSVVVAIAIVVVFTIWWKRNPRRSTSHPQVKSILITDQRSVTPNVYELGDTTTSRANSCLQSDDAVSLPMITEQSSVIDTDGDYLPMIKSPQEADNAIYARLLGKLDD